MAQPVHLAPELLLRSRYQIVRLLDEQGNTTSYLARDTHDVQLVIVQRSVLPADAPAAWLDTQERAVRARAGVRHPALLPILDFWREDDALHVVWPQPAGETLGEALDQRVNPFPAEVVLEWADSLLDALTCLHSAQPPTLLNALRPATIQRLPTKTVVLLERAVTAANPETDPYLAPEVVGNAPSDERADLYSFAATIYHLLTGAPPPAAAVRAAAIEQGKADPLIPAATVNQAISPELSTILQNALALDPNKRPRVAAAFRADLRALPKVAPQTETSTVKTPLARSLIGGLNRVWTPLWRIVVGLSVVLAIIATVPTTREVVTSAWFSIFPAFTPEQPGETLIVIARFSRPNGSVDTAAAHQEIHDGIESKYKALGMNDVQLRVEVAPVTLEAGDQQAAAQLGARYNASMVIWGSISDVRTTVNFLNLRQPKTAAAVATISDTAHAQIIADGRPFNKFITTDLPTETNFLALFAIGQSFYERSAYPEATTIISRAIELLPAEVKNPTDKQYLDGLEAAYFRLGWLYQTQNKLTDAIRQYDRAIVIDDKDAAAYYNRTIARSDSGDLKGALADYDQVIALDPKDAVAYINRGLARSTSGDLKGALADYDQAIALDPKYTKAYNNRGLARYTSGDLKGTLADYDQALALDPKVADAYYNRGNARYTSGDLKGALADYDQALAFDPKDAVAYINRGLARSTSGDLKGALADYDQAIALDPKESVAYYNRGLARYTSGDLKGALEDYDHALELDPKYVQAYYNRGIAHQTNGDRELARLDLERARDLFKDAADRLDAEDALRKLDGS